MMKVTSETLTDAAFSRLRAAFEKYNHNPSSDQRKALRAIQSTLTKMLVGRGDSHYFLSSLDPGVGKSTAILTWIQSYMDAFRETSCPEGVLICLDRLDEIDRYVKECDLPACSYSVLVGQGNLELNSKGLGVPGIDDALVLFTTKEQIRRRCNGGNIDATPIFHYKGKPRGIKVWDESLLVGKGISLRPSDIGKTFTDLESVSEEHKRAARGLMDALEDSEESFFHVPILPELPPMFLMEMRRGEARDLIELLWEKLSGRVISLKRFGGGRFIIDCCQSIPSDFPPCLILDASGRIKKTYNVQEQELKNLERLPYSNKSYRNLDIMTWERASGKEVAKDFPKIIPEIVKLIKERPEEEFLFLLHKDHEVSLSKALFELMGMTAWAKLKFCTWGNHTATNIYGEIPNVIAISTYTYNDAAYHAITRAAGMMTIESGNAPTATQISMVKRGEIASDFLQGVTRSKVRKSQGDTCPPCRLWMIVSPNSTLKADLPDIFPDANIGRWETQGFKLSNKQKPVFEAIRRAKETAGEANSFPAAPVRNGLKMPPSNFKSMLSHETFQKALESIGLELVTSSKGQLFRALI